MYHFTAFTVTGALERIESKSPYFEGLVPGATYYTTPLIYERACELQHGMGMRLFEERDGAGVNYWDSTSTLDGRRVGYFADGRLGDVCIHTAVWRELRWRYPAMDLHAYVRRHEADGHRIAAYNRDISGQHGNMPRYLSMCLTEDQVRSYDAWVVPSNVGYIYRGANERTHYELFEDDLGIEIEHKVPYLYLPDIEREAIRSVLSGMAGKSADGTGGEEGQRIASIFLERDHPTAIVQLDASERERTPRVSAWVAVVRELRRRYPAMTFGIVGNPDHRRVFAEMIGDFGNLVYFSPQPVGMYLSAHAILHLVAASSLVLSPDSFLMHASAAWSRPCVALWQDDPATCEAARIPSPESRIRHYDAVRAVGMTTSPETVVGMCEEVMG